MRPSNPRLQPAGCKAQRALLLLPMPCAPECLPAWRLSDAPLPAHAAAGLHGCPSDALLPAHADGGELATAAEYERLAARLAALPTSEAEDQALLDGGTVTGALWITCRA